MQSPSREIRLSVGALAARRTCSPELSLRLCDADGGACGDCCGRDDGGRPARQVPQPTSRHHRAPLRPWTWPDSSVRFRFISHLTPKRTLDGVQEELKDNGDIKATEEWKKALAVEKEGGEVLEQYRPS